MEVVIPTDTELLELLAPNLRKIESIPEEVPVKVEEPLSDAIKCESGPDNYRCYEDEETTISTDTTTAADR